MFLSTYSESAILGRTASPLGAAVGMLIVDAVFFALLAYYFDAVMPSEFGVRRHPLFFLDAIRNRCSQSKRRAFLLTCFVGGLGC